MERKSLHNSSSYAAVSCRYCEFLSEPRPQRQFYNFSLSETENFVVIPSLGSIVPGWLLIVPKQHCLNIGAVSSCHYTELRNLVDLVTNVVDRTYGAFTIFEHGPACSATSVGCGIDHAHLHVVPMVFPYEEICQRENLTQLKLDEPEGFSSHKYLFCNKIPYLFIKAKNRKARFYTADAIPSQFFRRLIANAVGKDDLYDYKENLFLNNVRESISTLRSSFELSTPR